MSNVGASDTPFAPLGLSIGLDQRVLYTFRPSGAKEVFSMRILDTFRPAGANVRGAMNCARTNAFLLMVDDRSEMVLMSEAQ